MRAVTISTFVLLAILHAACGQDSPTAPTPATAPAAVSQASPDGAGAVPPAGSAPGLGPVQTVQNVGSASTARGEPTAFNSNSHVAVADNGKNVVFIPQGDLTICMKYQPDQDRGCYEGGHYGVRWEGWWPPKGAHIEASIKSVTIGGTTLHHSIPSDKNVVRLEPHGDSVTTAKEHLPASTCNRPSGNYQCHNYGFSVYPIAAGKAVISHEIKWDGGGGPPAGWTVGSMPDVTVHVRGAASELQIFVYLFPFELDYPSRAEFNRVKRRKDDAVRLMNRENIRHVVRHVRPYEFTRQNCYSDHPTLRGVDCLTRIENTRLPRFFSEDPTQWVWNPVAGRNNGGLRWLRRKIEELSD